MSADNFGIISFGNHIEFARDVYKVICDLFEKHGMNRVSWSAFVENPAVKGYRNFIKSMAVESVLIIDRLQNYWMESCMTMWNSRF